MSKEMLSKLKDDQQKAIDTKFPHLANYCYIIAPNLKVLNDVLDSLRSHSFKWEDPTLQASKELFCKRHKSLELRMIGKFRHYFYQAAQNEFDELPGMVINGERQYQLRIVGGILYVFQNHDSIALLHFTRELVKDNTGVEPDIDGFKLYGYELHQVETIIEACLLAAEDDLE